MKITLWQEFGKQILLSIGIFSVLFLILYIVEWAIPSLCGMLLQWQDPAFVVGIPASVIRGGIRIDHSQSTKLYRFCWWHAYGSIVSPAILFARKL